MIVREVGSACRVFSFILQSKRRDGSRVAFKNVRIAQFHDRLGPEKITGLSRLVLHDSNLFVSITGTLYEGEIFKLQFTFGARYPFESPQVSWTQQYYFSQYDVVVIFKKKKSLAFLKQQLTFFKYIHLAIFW